MAPELERDERAADPLLAPVGLELPAEAALSVDVAVVGGGPTGMLAALGAVSAGWRTALIAPYAGTDPRTTALLMPTVRLLEGFGVWQAVREAAAPLVTMRLIDATGRLPRAPEIAFDASEAGLDAFGYNVPNNALNAALDARLADTKVIRLNAHVNNVRPGTPARIAAGSDVIAADLVVAADGAESTVRQACGMSVRRWDYDQAALVTTLRHERSHDFISTEFHTAAGPFTLVPLPGDRSSLVWVARPDDVARRKELDNDSLAREVEAQAHRLLGEMAIDGPRGAIPLGGLIATRFGQGNVVLVGEAGHRFPPIGAQGLNLGFRDCASLHKLFVKARHKYTLGGLAETYDRARRLDVGARTVGVDLLNRSLLADFAPASALRAFGVTAARNVAPLRKLMMRIGMGVGAS